jgi:hypothetical protein
MALDNHPRRRDGGAIDAALPEAAALPKADMILLR